MSFDLQNEVNRRLDAVEGLLPELQRLLTTMQEEDLQIRTKSTRRDLVTKADVASEETILHFLRSLFPGDAILAEESGQHQALSSSVPVSGLTWCIDPVDGTVNYAHGLPLYAVSFGLLFENEPVGGLVFLPALNDTYRGAVQSGATKNGRPIRVSPNTDLESALIVTGFPYRRQEMIDILTGSLRGVLLNARGIRRTGSAALDLCWVAEGRFDGHYEWNLSPWDTCGALTILREAGGTATNLKGEHFRLEEKMLVATNGFIHEQLRATLLEAGASEPHAEG